MEPRYLSTFQDHMSPECKYLGVGQSSVIVYSVKMTGDAYGAGRVMPIAMLVMTVMFN